MKPDIRYLNDMKEVLYDQPWAKTAPNLELYYMYRGLKYEQGLRYDLTVMPFQMLGREFVKTKGHEHPEEFSELYEVIEGQAIFLMQKYNGKKVKDVYLVETKKGDKVFVPPYYGHITINPGPSQLKMANWVAAHFQSDYSLFIKKQGGCHYYLQIDGQRIWLKNEKYGKVPGLRIEEPNKNIPQDLKKALMGT